MVSYIASYKFILDRHDGPHHSSESFDSVEKLKEAHAKHVKADPKTKSKEKK